MKLKIRSLSTFALATGLLLSTSQIQPVHADDQHERACSNKTLNGSYGNYRTGTTSAGPLAAVGFLFFDGNGNVSGSQSISRNGVFTFDAAISGPYEVAADCTAKFLTDTGDEVARVLIVDGGNEFYELSETLGNAVYGVGKKIHSADDNHDR
jgi:hypothetical protein